MSGPGNAMDIISIILLGFSITKIIVEAYPVQGQMDRQLSFYLVPILLFFVLFSLVLLCIVPRLVKESLRKYVTRPIFSSLILLFFFYLFSSPLFFFYWYLFYAFSSPKISSKTKSKSVSQNQSLTIYHTRVIYLA